MRASTQLKLDSIIPVLQFFLQFPDPSPAAVAAVARLRAVSDKVRALLATVLKAQGILSAEAIQRDRAIPRLREDLAHLVRIAGVAARHEGDDELRASLRPGPLTRTIPRAAARAALEAATRHRVVLIQYGLPEGMLARIRQDLDRYCAVLEARAGAQATIAATNSEFELLADEARLIILHLDALNRIRFAEDPESLAIWVRVKTVQRGKAGRRARAAEGESRPAAGQ